MANTEYVVFVMTEDETFSRIGQVQASSPKAAISHFADKDALEVGSFEEARYATTPVRNWTELSVQAEVVTRLKIG